jgi:hypothetical protein
MKTLKWSLVVLSAPVVLVLSGCAAEPAAARPELRRPRDGPAPQAMAETTEAKGIHLGVVEPSDIAITFMD